MEEPQFLRTEVFGGDYKTTNNLDCALICAHGDNGTDFLNQFPELSEMVSAPDLLPTYLAIERDAGTRKLSKEIAERLATEGIKTAVLEVLIPRGMLDCNRTTPNALIDIYPETDHPIFDQLKSIHQETTGAIMKTLDQLGPQGVAMDVHSMRDHDLFFPREAPSDMKRYVDAHLDPPRRSNLRFLDLITHEQSGDSMRRVANPDLEKAVSRALDGARIPHQPNDPYPTAPHILTTAYLKKIPAAAIDVPKSWLCDGTDLSDLQPNNSKVGRIAHPLASAIIQFRSEQTH